MSKLFSIVILFVLAFSVKAQDEVIFKSKFLDKNVNTWVFKPENSDGKTALPTLIILHGYSGDYKTWHELVDLQKAANESGFVFICPDGLFDSWYFNSKLKNGSAYFSFFTEEFLPRLKKLAPIDEQNLFIDGYSMGGHGAMFIFLQQPQWFRAAGSMSGVLDLKCSSNKGGSLKKHLGTYNAEAWKTYTAMHYLPQGDAKKPILIDCGTKDHLIACNREFAEKARKVGYTVTYIEKPGTHNRVYWKAAFPRHLKYFQEIVSMKK